MGAAELKKKGVMFSLKLTPLQILNDGKHSNFEGFQLAMYSKIFRGREKKTYESREERTVASLDFIQICNQDCVMTTGGDDNCELIFVLVQSFPDMLSPISQFGVLRNRGLGSSY